MNEEKKKALESVFGQIEKQFGRRLCYAFGRQERCSDRSCTDGRAVA